MAAGFKVMIAGAGVAAAGLAISHAAAEVVRGPESVGALRSPVQELVRGLKFSVSQTVRYEDNLVRTANDAETLALYGTDDASDIVSITSLDVELSLKEERSELKFLGNVGYANYSEFDQFSGTVASARGEWDWYFSDRCAFNVNSGVEWRLANFNDVDQVVENRQVETDADLSLGCFIIERIRATGEVFGGEVDNDETTVNFADLRYRGVQGALAYITAKENEVGLRYRVTETERPNLPVVGDYENRRWDIYGKYHLGDRFRVGAAFGFETVEDDFGDENDRTSSEADVSWFPTDRLAFGADFVRTIEDVEDLAGVTRETDRYGASVNWKAHPRATVGAFVRFENDTLDAPPLFNFAGGGLIEGTKEETFTTGATLRHSVFNRVEVIWSAGYTDRSSDEPLREYDGAFAGVTVGIGF